MGKGSSNSNIKKIEKRKRQRRGSSERRESVRWEPEKSNRRSRKDRRKSEHNWDDALKR